VLSLEDIEELLGPRPYKTRELRNVDRFRHGFDDSFKLKAAEDKEEEAEEKIEENKQDKSDEDPPSDPSRIVAS